MTTRVTYRVNDVDVVFVKSDELQQCWVIVLGQTRKIPWSKKVDKELASSVYNDVMSRLLN